MESSSKKIRHYYINNDIDELVTSINQFINNTVISQSIENMKLHIIYADTKVYAA